MRFNENGPSIPHELLIARDEGRVVFVCGAGVSRARAGLSDFFGLAENVIRKLGISADSPAGKILNEAREIHKRTGIEGLISADRIFGLLERDFLVHDIESAVAKALQPHPDVDLSAHRILLDLATTPEGKVRLVTTNFDRLFDECNDALQVWQPPRLPDPSRHDEMDGIIYLHGCANKNYSGSEGDGFILSSSAFGRAYLSESWATTFFREIIDRYVVVFVGYSADDPPVQYLLEALNKKSGRLTGVYSFQSGVSSEAAARWLHKGVEAIPYSEEDGHRALWETLEAWAVRARDPKEWYQTVIDLARKGPENLYPYERGQVAHIISTLEGARKFSEADPPPPAEWLCVFDPHRRYAKPGHVGRSGAQDLFVDPFDLYGLDSDLAPKKINPDDYHSKRDIPKNAWDAFTSERLDRQNLQNDGFSALRGHWATTTPRLPSRLNQMGVWISKVADQAASVWWAASQTALHPDIQQQIKWELRPARKDVPYIIRQAWHYLFEAWDERVHKFHRDWYDLKAAIDNDGWNSAAVRKYAAINRANLKVEQNTWGGPKPPVGSKDLRLEDLLRLDVEYPDPQSDTQIPDEWLAFAVRELRKNLESALQLETEIGGYGLTNLSPIIPDDRPDIDSYGRTHGLSGSIISFSSLFERLIKLDVYIARQEFSAWPVDDDKIFSRLRIWAGGKTELVPAKTFAKVITSLNDDAFWSRHHKRDLLLVLAKRYRELPDHARKKIENMLLKGPPKWEGEEDDRYGERRAWATLNRITWLANNGCRFSFDLKAETNRLRQAATNWKPEHAVKAAESIQDRGGSVRTDTDHSSLLHEPVGSILSKARELSGRAEGFLLEKDPFAGLSAKFPVRAFSALNDAARRNEYPEWAWRTFLSSEARKNDKPKFSALIAHRISRHPDSAVTDLIRPVSDWVSNTSKLLASLFPSVFENVISKLIRVLQPQPPGSSTTIVRGDKKPDWIMEAINAPAGKIAQALLNDPRTSGCSEVGGGFPDEWLAYVEELLSLDGDPHRHAIVIFSHNLNWFYVVDPNWTESHLLSALDENNEDDRDAFWSGFFLGARVPEQKLYIRMKPDLLAIAKGQSLTKRGYCEVLAEIILVGWASRDGEMQQRFISNDEMRDVLLHAGEDFRSHILWQLEIESARNENSISDKWSEMLLELLRYVWPRQNSVKTSTISARLCELAFSKDKYFPELADIILPLLTTIDRDHLVLRNFGQSKDNIVNLYPKQTLSLLHAILPDNVSACPYDTGEVLERISEAGSSLRSDERLLELKRKWNAR